MHHHIHTRFVKDPALPNGRREIAETIAGPRNDCTDCQRAAKAGKLDLEPMAPPNGVGAKGAARPDEERIALSGDEKALVEAYREEQALKASRAARDDGGE